MKYQILIYSRGKVYCPIVEGKVKIKWDRNFRAGTLTFNVVKDKIIEYHEGDTVTFSIDGEVIFKGYVFTKRRSKTQIIETTCYDSIRYLKSADTYQYTSKSASDLIKQICKDRNLEIGEIEDSEYKIPKKLEQNQEYLSMIKAADDITLSQTGNLFTLFDDCGKVCYKSPKSMFVDYPITYDKGVDFEYITSIDEGTYNRIVVYIVDDNGNQLRKVVKQDLENIKKWGVLEYTVVTNNDEDIDTKSSQLLELLNRKFRSLTLKDIIGNPKIRAGSLVPVRLMAIGDINISSLMLVNSVTHTFYDGYHFMDLEVFNKDIMPMASGDGIITDKKKIRQEAMAEGFSPYSGEIVPAPTETAGKALGAGQSAIGAKYLWGGNNPVTGIDCSGFVQWSYRQAGANVPGRLTSAGLASNPSYYGFVEVPFSERQPGDVLWQKGHVAMQYDSTRIIESGGVSKSIMGYSGVCISKGKGRRFNRAYRYIGG